ncbi:hypothetical protein WR25_25626 [Diploscapter pachys]|uniref:MOFRL-associated domain-containing protein n=1 Tax=Diploscapter pachys TaxID=2018661 RepID=A0A2A2LLC9_9BILA|nr:hypothetical protein WR25_25626 [Diploscapter pachys]
MKVEFDALEGDKSRRVEALEFDGTHLILKSQSDNSRKLIDLTGKRLFVAGFGKAVLAMFEGVPAELPVEEAIIIAPEAALKVSDESESLKFRYTIFFAARNNLPDENSVKATEKFVEFLKERDSAHSIFLFLISGGGSALLCSPVNGVSLEEKQATIKMLTSNGADIKQLNIVRQALSNVKGGQLLGKIQQSQAISLIISDIVGDSLEFIASGPTVIQTTQGKTAQEVIRDLNLEEKLPKNVDERVSIRREAAVHENVSNLIISSNKDFLNDLKNLLNDHNCCIVTDSITGDATEFGRELARLVMSRRVSNSWLTNLDRSSLSPSILLFGGETTVKIRGNGKGGRSQELALAFLVEILETCQTDDLKELPEFVLMAAGTDGQDGPTDADGAVLERNDIDLQKIPEILDSAKKSLENSDSYNFWSTFNEGECHLKTGLTGTNVMDAIVLSL